MGTFNIISKPRQFKKDLKRLVHNLFTKDLKAEIDDECERIFLELGWIKPKDIEYEFTEKGNKGLLKAVKDYAKTIKKK